MEPEIFQIRNDAPSPFVVGKNQTFRVKTFGYIDKNNPTGDALIDPEDEARVKITKIGELPDGSIVYTAENGCKCGVNIEVFDI